MKVNRNLCMGLILTGVLGFYEESEILEDEGLRYLSNKLEVKNTSIRNGSADFLERVQRTSRKKKKNERDKKYIAEAIEKNKNFEKHLTIADRAWKSAQRKFGEDNEITTTRLIHSILFKEQKVKEFYGISDKFIKEFAAVGELKEQRLLPSLKTANMLVSMLDAEITHFNFNEKKETV